MDTYREIQQYLHYHPLSSRDDIAKGIAFEGSDATMKRLLSTAIQSGDVVAEGKARATRYRLSPQAHLLMPLNLDTYFALDVDERQVQTSFNFELIREQLPSVELFTKEECLALKKVDTKVATKISEPHWFDITSKLGCCQDVKERLSFERRCKTTTAKLRSTNFRVAVVAVIFRGVWVKFLIVKTGQGHFGQNRFLMRLRSKPIC